MHTHFSRAAACVIGIVALSASVQANPMAEQMINAGATLQAVAEACGSHTSDQLQKMQNQQRASIAAIGISTEQFNKIFKERHAAARSQIATATPAQKSAMCKDVQGMELPG